jgi:hypothetical protein
MKMKKIVSLLLIVSMCMIVLTSSPVVGISARGKPVPATLIESPADGATVSDTVTIVLYQNADLYIDGALVVTWVTSYDWDTTAFADGDIDIKAQVDRKTKQTITVSVSNGGTPPPPPPPGNKYAVIAGVSDYTDDGVGDLSYCDDDARDWKSYFMSQGYTIVACLIDAQATERAVADAVADMIAMATADDQIAFVTSGHGTLSGKDHLLLYSDCFVSESTGDGYVGGVVPDFDLAAWFANAPCATFIFVDHCNSGGLNEAVHDGIYMTTTCGPRGYGYDVPAYENGAWTYWFLEAGLVGQGFTTAEDCFDWASANYPYGGKDAPCEFDQLTGFYTF